MGIDETEREVCLKINLTHFLCWSVRNKFVVAVKG